MSFPPYYQDDTTTLYHGDALEVMARLPSEYVDVVVTSPPYNMGLVPGGGGRGMYRPGASNKAGRFRDGYGTHDDAMPQDEYDDWQRECLNEMWRIARFAVYYNHRPRVEHGRLRDPLSGFYGNAILRQRIIWNRGTGIDVNLRAYCTRGEYILLFAKEGFNLVNHSASGCGDVWDLGMEHQETGHPAPFPESMPMRVLLTTGAESVLDPFVGSGTTLRAAKNLGRTAIGIELEESYCALAVARLGQEVLDLSA